MNPSKQKTKPETKQVKARWQLVWFVVLAWSSAAASALECPPFIPASSVQVSDVPKGWRALIGAPLYLHEAAPMSGPPEQMGELSDFKQTSAKDTWTNTYKLDGKFAEGKWLACRYGESGQVTLSKRLDDNIQQCVFTYRKGEHVGQTGITIICR